MKKLLAIGLLFIITVAGSTVHAQSLANTNWKSFLPQIGDTITIHFKTDSSFVTGSAGDVFVRSHWQVSGDTLILTDYDGQYACLNQTGKYIMHNADGAITFKLVDDPCEGRAGSLAESKWMKAL